MRQDLLIEIGTEELPPKALLNLSGSFSQSIVQSLSEQGAIFSSSQSFATPRRLAIIIQQLDEWQQDQAIEKLGPAVSAAFDKDGKPSRAALGFASSNNTTVEALETTQTDKGERLVFRSVTKGRPVAELLPEIISNALAALPIPKRMRWGASRAEFVRPVKWLNLSFGNTVIDAEILGIKASNLSYGHRFHAPEAFVANATNYQDELQKRFVIADFSQRRAQILDQVQQLAAKQQGNAIIPEALLDEVAALVEWPVPLVCSFEERFLAVPQEALIYTMQDNQKYFCLVDDNGKLLPNFITVANIESEEPRLVIMGNEKVVRPRLTDAEFFFATDKKHSLESRREALKNVVFQQKLGSIFDKTERIAQLSALIAQQLGADVALATRAGQLAKSDLNSEMVLEFTDLQGIMGYYYALNDKEPEAIAKALRDQYTPAGNNDRIPENDIGQILALADRIDTLIGIFGIGQQPTGSKDPFALRRATLGILRIILTAQLNLDLRPIYQLAFDQYADIKGDTVEQALAYTMERFKSFYHEQGFATEIYLAVTAKNISNALDFDKRVHAVQQFSELPEAEALAAANKRVSNILSKQEHKAFELNPALLQDADEKALYAALTDKKQALTTLKQASQYAEFLALLATLKTEIDRFFENVMVMTEDINLRNNRLALLAELQKQFDFVADISLLATK